MPERQEVIITGLVMIALLGAVLAAFVLTVPKGAADTYIVLAPKNLYKGTDANIPVSLFNASEPASGLVILTLQKDGETVAEASGTARGKDMLSLHVPADIESGKYTLSVESGHFKGSTEIAVKDNFIILLETDKPLYKPSQEIHLRILTLNAELKPLCRTVVVEILDAKGLKVYRKEILTDEYGFGTIDFPLSSEPNLGTWKISAYSSDAETNAAQLDVRVEEYVLPKYEVDVELPREWFLADEPINGELKAEYSFGKAVNGEARIEATRYLGYWKRYAELTVEVENGTAHFELPPVEYVAGVPGERGMGNVILNATVIEEGTGYEVTETKLLTVALAPLSIQIIPESPVFKPELPFSSLLVTETPDNQPRDAALEVTVQYYDENFSRLETDEQTLSTKNGLAMLRLTPPERSARLEIAARAEEDERAYASTTLTAAYSPSASFVHIEQITEGTPQVGDRVSFKVYATHPSTFFYEVVASAGVLFSDFTTRDTISFDVTPQMVPSAKLLVYQILPTAEVAADYLPFDVESEFPQELSISLSEDEAKPGESVEIKLETDGKTKAKIGVAAVDTAVFMLSEQRINLKAVFDELEQLYMAPQAEIHEAYPSYLEGAKEIFEDAGFVVLSNQEVPAGKDLEREGIFWERGAGGLGAPKGIEDGVPVPAVAPAPVPTVPPTAPQSEELTEVTRIRSFFPETWLWSHVLTDDSGSAKITAETPDTITTWKIHAVSVSQEGLGMCDAELRVFQPFFVTVDLPYSVIRGEEFPVRVALYNYLDEPQEVVVDISTEEGESEWFKLLDSSQKVVNVEPNGVASASFTIKPTAVGVQRLKITARSPKAADAVVKELLVVPEGVEREIVQNIVLKGGTSETISTEVPLEGLVEDSARAYLAVTGSYLTQTLDGLESLLQMPFGCGEQNMIFMAPDIHVTSYLKESGQLKPEIMAKAELLMLTGYQRELTFRRTDGSFSAFGQSDKEGSLWLTAFVLKTFSLSKEFIYIDDDVLTEAAEWIVSKQNADGSWDAVGFVHHEEMIGGLQGKTALSAYVTAALTEANTGTNEQNIENAVHYLESKLDEINDSYTMALTTYALAKRESARSDEAVRKLLSMAKEDEEGPYWTGDGELRPQPRFDYGVSNTVSIETTAYALLALNEKGDVVNASKAARWLISKRNAEGGFESTQDTVVALEALTNYCTGRRANVNLQIAVTAEGEEIGTPDLNSANYDVLQVIAVPVGERIELQAEGDGEALIQLVVRYNSEPDTAPVTEGPLTIDVNYDATSIEVEDTVKVRVKVSYEPELPLEAGMTVLDISVPTGFAPISETLDEVVLKFGEEEPRITRYDIAARKVIFYIENMKPGDALSFSFDALALYPVRATVAPSRAYAYYQPEVSGEDLGGAEIVVV
jgi:CD109 antigen